LSVFLNGSSTGAAETRVVKHMSQPGFPQVPVSRCRNWNETTFTISQGKGLTSTDAMPLPIPATVVASQSTEIRTRTLPLFPSPEPREALLTRVTLLL
jgi:hypothetical protein